MNPTLFEGLDTVAWSSMVHCRGPADDLPALLRDALANPSLEARENACATLWDSIQYQGSVFEPTSHAVVFMTRALPSLAVAEQARLVSMLGQFAFAYTMTEGQGLLQWVKPGDPERARVEAQFAREGLWVAATKRACWGALDALRASIDTRDEALAIEVPFTLAALFTTNGARSQAPATLDVTSIAREIANRLWVTACDPVTPRAAASAVYALATFADDVPETVSRLETMLTTASMPVRAVAALQLLTLQPHDSAVDVLTDALRRHAEHAAWFEYPFPWRAGHWRFSIIPVLCGRNVDDAALDRAMPALLELFRHTTNQHTFIPDVMPLLARSLGSTRLGVLTRRTDLPVRVASTLEALVENPAMWGQLIGNVDNALRPFGLLNDRASWMRMLIPVR